MQFSSVQQQTILLSYLNWGRGHLSRCIDVCRKLLAQQNTLYVACTADDFAIIREYVDVQYIPFEEYPFHFSGEGDFAKDLWKSRKEISEFIQIEQKMVDELVRQLNITLVLSDHRYGFRSQFVTSIFMTHQLQLALKWWQRPAQWVHNRWMKNFTFLWVMDDQENSLAGKLSAIKQRKNAFYIGHFSRFEERNDNKQWHVGVTNGPFPYNQQLLRQLEQDKELDVILTHLESEDKRVVRATSWRETDAYFYQAVTVSAYCGYSTLMDLKRLKCRGKLIPTKGQSEQEYLFQLHQTFDFTK